MSIRWVLLVLLVGCGRMGFDTVALTDDAGNSVDGANTTPRLPDGALVPDAPPGTLTPSTAGDTYLQGIDSTPINGADSDLQVGRGNGGTNKLALLRFDLSTLPQVAVERATLRLYQYEATGSGTMGIEIYRLTQSWDEASATWTDASTGTAWTGTGGGAYASTIYTTSSVAIGAVGSYDFDITTLVNEWLTATSPNEGLEITYGALPPTNTFVGFASREHATIEIRPQLLITP